MSYSLLHLQILLFRTITKNSLFRFGKQADHDDDFTRHVAYQPPQVSAFNVVIDPTREQTRGKNVKIS